MDDSTNHLYIDKYTMYEVDKIHSIHTCNKISSAITRYVHIQLNSPCVCPGITFFEGIYNKLQIQLGVVIQVLLGEHVDAPHQSLYVSYHHGSPEHMPSYATLCPLQYKHPIVRAQSAQLSSYE